MQNWLLISPILIPLSAAILATLSPRGRAVQGGVSIIASLLLMAASFTIFAHVREGTILTLQMGNWPPPFGVVMVADLLSALMLCITSVIALATSVYALVDIHRGRIAFGFYPFLQFLLCGICGAFLTGDLFNLYVWFEVMLIASFALLSLGGEKGQLYGTIKYVALNLISTLLLLSAIGLLYGVTGSLNMADLSVKVPQVENTHLITAIAIMFMIAFGIKSAVFPLFFWLPASYHMPPVSVSAIFAGLLTKVGIYALYRVFTLIFTHDIGWTHHILLWIAGLTMVTGVLCAIVQISIRRILSFHVISHIGYMVMGLALFSKMAIMGGVFYMLHHIIVIANLFLIGGVMRRLSGSSHVYEMGGFYAAAPGLVALFMIPALSLAGMPPLSGFWAKLAIIRSGLELEVWLLVAAALFTGLFTLYSMMKIWSETFWKKHPHGDAPDWQGGLGLFTSAGGGENMDSSVPVRAWLCLLLPCGMLAVMTLCIGLWPQPFFAITGQIAEQLLNPASYVEAVLGVPDTALPDMPITGE